MNCWRELTAVVWQAGRAMPWRFRMRRTASFAGPCTAVLLLLSLSLSFTAAATQAVERAPPSRPVTDRPPEPSTLFRGPRPTPQSISRSGPYQVKRYGEREGLRNGPRYRGATVYYPADRTSPLASIVIVPGYISPERSIRAWGPFYASHGIVAMTIGTNRPQDDPAARRRALLDAITSLKLENRRVTSPLRGRLALSRFAVSGWSMGGGGALEAATRAPQLKAVIALCPWNPYQTFSHRVPVLFLAGQRDRLAPVAENARRHYDQTPATTPKLLFEVRNEGHWIANTPQGGDNAIGRLALSWLKVYLEEDLRYRPFLETRPASASQFLSNLKRIESSSGKSSSARPTGTDVSRFFLPATLMHANTLKP